MRRRNAGCRVAAWVLGTSSTHPRAAPRPAPASPGVSQTEITDTVITETRLAIADHINENRDDVTKLGHSLNNEDFDWATVEVIPISLLVLAAMDMPCCQSWHGGGGRDRGGPLG